jgi:hypothetical protein
MSFQSMPVTYKGYDPSRPSALFSRSRESYKNYSYKFILSFFKECIQRPLRPYVFHASTASFKRQLKEERLTESRGILEAAGGECVPLETYDGAKLDCMYFSARIFKERVEALGGQFAFVEKNGIKKAILIIPSGARELYDLLKNMHASFEAPLFSRSYYVDIKSYYRGEEEESCLRLERRRAAATILTQGNACIYEFDRNRILDVLLSGQDCVAYNIRGTGRSSGSPSEQKTYIDIETVYQFLVHEKGFFPSDITVHGYCLGSGPATQLARSHRGVNLILDRSFCRLSNVMADVAVGYILPEEKMGSSMLVRCARTVCRGVVSGFLNMCVFGYDNLSRMKHVTGSVCVVDATEDNVISPGDMDALRREAEARSKVKTDITFEGEHCGSWDEKTWAAYRKHLKDRQLSRSFGVSPIPPPGLFSRAVSAIGGSIGQFSRGASRSAAGSQLRVIGASGVPAAAAAAAAGDGGGAAALAEDDAADHLD